MMKAHLFEPKIFNNMEKVARLAGNLFIRSVGFMVIYVGFTAIASNYGDVQLAVSSIMMKLFMLFSYFVDGFAYAGEALTGRFIGERNAERLHAAVRILFLWCIGVGLAFTVIYAAAGEGSVRVVTDNEPVIAASHPFLPWLIAMPLISCLAVMWDGIYIGAAAGKEVRNCMLWAALGFVLGYLCCYKSIGIQALYVGYFVHLLVRTLYLSFLWKKTKGKAFSIA